MNKIRTFLVAPALMAAACAAQAQLLEDLDVRREGADAVVQVRFTVPVQFRRTVASRSNDVAQVFYDVVAPAVSPSTLQSSERRLAPAPGLPQITVTDEAVGRADLSRRLIVRFSTLVPFRVRAGKGDRAIEIVLTGMGAGVSEAPRAAPTTVAAAPKGYFIRLQSTTDPNQQLDPPIPAALQAYPVSTAKRIVAGQTFYEINIGPFETEAEARKALEPLRARFPQAAITGPGTEPGRLAPMTPPEPAPAVAPAAAETGAAAAPPASAAEVETQAAALLAAAKDSLAREDFAATLGKLNQLLELPPNASSREAQEMAGRVRLKVGDFVQARAEFELFLKLYPTGADSDRVRQELERLPPPVAAAEQVQAPPPVTSSVSGSVSQFYYGGQSKVRTEEFQDSPFGGLPEKLSDNTLSGTDQKQAVTSLDFNWRHRDADSDMRFVFRDSWTANLMPNGADKNRLSALYFDHRSSALGTNLRIGRQSPTGGGVLGRFDGIQAGYAVRPKWRLNAVAGVPVETLFDSQRRFVGASIDAEALTPELSGSVYGIQQTIDGELDRRALGTELRYFSGGVSASGQLDYDTTLRRLNIASVQGTWIAEDSTTVNVLYDRRATPMLMLGNALFFQNPDPNSPDPTQRVFYTRFRDLVDPLLGQKTLEGSRLLVKGNNSYTTQALLGVTRPIATNWLAGADIRLTNVGAIPAVPELQILPTAGTGNLWSLGAQLIGTNLYSERDTHVFSVTVLTGPTYDGKLFSYNNSSQVAESWQFEPSFRYYVQNDNLGLHTVRWSPGLRVSWRLGKQASLESEASVERSKITSATVNETSNRVFYYLGGRYDF